MKTTVVFFLIFLISNLLISFLAPFIIPSSMTFPYKNMIESFQLPFFISSFANFDGAHYLRISDHWYEQYEQTFFPLYPLTVKFVTFILINRLLAGLVISYTALLGGLIVFRKLLFQFGLNKEEVLWVIGLLLLFPSSFYFGAVYTESLFFFLFVITIFLFQKKLFIPAFFCGVLLGLCRLQGFLIIFPLLGIWLKAVSVHKMKEVILPTGVILSPIIGTGLYMWYLGSAYNDPFMFYHAQEAVGVNRSVSSIILLPQVYFRYGKILALGEWNYAYLTALLEVFIFSLVFFALCFSLFTLLKNRLTLQKNLDMVGIHLFSLGNILLPTLTGTFSSIPRYALLSLSFFIVLSTLKSLGIKIITILLFAILYILMLSLFVRGFFVS